MMYPLVRDLAAADAPIRVPVAVTCRVLGFSRQAYYQWLRDPIADRVLADAYLTDEAIELHREDPEFGYRFISDELRAAGHQVGENRVQRLCSRRGLLREHARRKRQSAGSDDRTPEAVVEPLIAPELRIERAEDVLDLLVRQVRAVEGTRSADALMKARVVGQLLGPALRAIEARDAAERERPLHDRETGAAMATLFNAVLDRLELTDEQRAAIPEAIREVLPLFSQPEGHSGR